MTYPDGEVVSTSYDDQGLPKRLHSDTYSVDYAGQGSDVSHNDVGNVTRIDDKGTTHFTHDALDRLTRAWTEGSDPATYNRPYTYDAIGNITSRGTVSYTYGSAAHIHAVTSLTDNSSYTYDANGNMITRVEDSVTYQQVFDIENRLVSVPAGGQTTFLYDVDGVRAKRTASGGTTVYVGQYYEVQGSTIREHYYLGGRQDGQLAAGPAGHGCGRPECRWVAPDNVF